LANQVRDFDYLYLDYTKLNVAAITDAEISDYYKNHEQEFFSNDKVSVNYVMISKKDIAKKLNPTDVELESYFLVNSHRYRADDQFKVNIYSVSPETDDSSDSDIGADLVAKLNPKLPVVDMINDGGTVNIEVSSSWKNLHDVKPEIKDQLNKMAAGEIKVVKINGGYNIVELISKRKTELKLNNFRKLVRSDWVNEHAEKKYAAMLDELSDLAYTADSLDEIAKHFGAKVLVSKDFTLDSGADGISKSAFVRNAAFSEDVLENDLNSSVIKLNDNESVVIHLTKKSMAKQRPLSEVKSEIKSILILEKQKEEVEKAANKLVEDLQSEKPIDSFLAQNDVSWKSLKNIRREGIMNRIAMEVKDDVFDMPRPSGSNMSYKSIKLENGNYVVVKLVKVSIANPLILYPSAVHDRYLKEMKETANSSFEYDLRKASKVKYNKAIIEKIN
jgi:peptidyl-prolyl cis-trans isomerase D